MKRYGSIEGGGTKFVCGIGNAQTGSVETLTIPTTDPDATFAAIGAFFGKHAATLAPASVGIGGFGPINIDPASPGYGTILRTPKPGWEGTNIVRRARELLGIPVALDTDVNAAALAESRIRGGTCRSLAYVTVGTGIGVGLVSGDRSVHGGRHAEMGHIRIPRHAAHRDFAGICPFHGDCLEGLASGPAVHATWKSDGFDFAPDHAFWEVEAFYIAQLCSTLLLTFSPDVIVLGGGVMKQTRLFGLIRQKTAELLAGYLQGFEDGAALEGVIVPPISVEAPGLIGGYILAEERAGIEP